MPLRARGYLGLTQDSTFLCAHQHHRGSELFVCNTAEENTDFIIWEETLLWNTPDTCKMKGWKPLKYRTGTKPSFLGELLMDFQVCDQLP